jgi:hypothetical protein
MSAVLFADANGRTAIRGRLEALLLMLVENHLRCRAAHLDLRAQVLDLQCLLFQVRRESLNFLLSSLRQLFSA